MHKVLAGVLIAYIAAIYLGSLVGVGLMVADFIRGL